MEGKVNALFDEGSIPELQVQIQMFVLEVLLDIRDLLQKPPYPLTESEKLLPNMTFMKEIQDAFDAPPEPEPRDPLFDKLV